jgi:hypothetical protein
METRPGPIDDAPISGDRQELAAEADSPELVGVPIPGIYYPEDVAPPLTSGGIGNPTDGTQVVHRVETEVPGKPMVPRADDPDLRLVPPDDGNDLAASVAGGPQKDPA